VPKLVPKVILFGSRRTTCSIFGSSLIWNFRYIENSVALGGPPKYNLNPTTPGEKIRARLPEASSYVPMVYGSDVLGTMRPYGPVMRLTKSARHTSPCDL
jgi:hypothetical protein